MDQAKLYKKQISFTEWFEKINHPKLKEMRQEDYAKRERLKEINKIIPLPFDKPYQFPATALAEKTPEFQEFLEKHGEELCALRLNPIDVSVQKHRLRGPKIKEVMEWFVSLDIDPTKYNADFVPHCDNYKWSTIFVVNKNGIFGEIIKGAHYQLSQGFYKENKPITFSFDFTNWKLQPHNEQALDQLKLITNYLNINEEQKRQQLKDSFSATFTNNYFEGYFETVSSKEFGLWFVDYNRILGNMFADFSLQQIEKRTEQLSGNPACKGKVTGKVRIISPEQLETTQFQENEILVTEMTSPDFVPLMQKAAAIITDKGGILSHAAIVSRELNTPCITGVGNATQTLHDGDEVEVDADTGVIRRL